MAAADVVRARIDATTKKEAAAVLAAMGLSVSDAIRMLLMKVAAERALPFEVGVPNAVTKRAILAAQRNDVATFTTVQNLLADMNDGDD